MVATKSVSMDDAVRFLSLREWVVFLFQDAWSEQLGPLQIQWLLRASIQAQTWIPTSVRKLFLLAR